MITWVFSQIPVLIFFQKYTLDQIPSYRSKPSSLHSNLPHLGFEFVGQTLRTSRQGQREEEGQKGRRNPQSLFDKVKHGEELPVQAVTSVSTINTHCN